MRDETLIKEGLAGNETALEVLVGRYQRVVYNLALRHTGNQDDAQEVTQQTFLKVLTRLDQYNERYKFFSWIYRIAVNESVNLLRKRTESTQDESEVMDTENQTDINAEQEEQHALLQRAIDRLDIKYRTVLILKHITGCNYQEISEVMELPISKVKSRLFTARQLLKQYLEGMGVSLA